MRERINQVMRARLDDENGTGSATSEEGFTLVELLIVVVVLGILAAVTVFGLSGTTATSYRAACNSDARSVEIAAEAYHANNSPNWPPDIPTLTQPDAANGNVVYLRTVPEQREVQHHFGRQWRSVLVNHNERRRRRRTNYDAGSTEQPAPSTPATRSRNALNLPRGHEGARARPLRPGPTLVSWHEDGWYEPGQP